MNTLQITQRAFAAALILALLLALLPTGALATAISGGTEILAGGSCGDDVSWSLDVFGTLTISGNGNIRDFKWREDRPWEVYRRKITEVVVGKGVTGIGEYAFYDCSRLTSVHISEGVTSIGDSAFQDCISLTGTTLPESLITIGWHAFSGCADLASVTIPNGVSSIGGGAFRSTGLTSIVLPESLTQIEQDMFSFCTQLTGVTIPESVTSIGHTVFYRCSSLTDVTIPEGVTSIGASAFYGCSSLTSVTIPTSVASIGSDAFKNCTGLTSVNILEGVTGIGNGAFSGCSNLTSVTIPEGVTSIENWVFLGCSSLTAVSIPDSVSLIKDYAFYGCDKLWHVWYTGTKKQWNAMSIGSNNGNLTGATRHCCADGNEISWVVSQEPTCTAEGVKTLTCSVCNDTMEASISRIKHSGEYQKTILPTCTETGYDEYLCDACGAVYHENRVSTLGHTFGHDGLCNDCGHRPDIMIYMADYYGEGWEGRAIEVYADGQLITTETLSSGCSRKVKILCDPNKTYTFKWVNDPYPYEICFEICQNGEILVFGKGNEYTDGQTIYTLESIPTPETETVTGSITGFGEGEATLTLTEAGKDQPLNTVTTHGQNYTLDVEPGTYILTVSKPNYVPRQYAITVGAEPVSLDVKICLIGDINGDGKVNVADTSKAYGHVKDTAPLTDYAFACADVDGNGKINVADTSKIYGHVKDTKPLW